MSPEKPKTAAHDSLSRLQARIAELESEVSRLRQPEVAAKQPFMSLPSVVLESITDGFVAFDSEFRYTWANTEAERLLDLSREQLLGRCVWDLFPLALGTIVEETFRKVLTERVPSEYESYYPPKAQWSFCKLYPTPDGGLALYWRDVTEQKKAEQALRASEKQLQFQAEILATTDDAVIVLDANENIRYLNAGAERLYRVNAADTLGKPRSALGNYFWLNPADEAQARAQLESSGNWRGEIGTILNDGTEIILSSTVNILGPDFGGGQFAVVRDVSDRRRTEMEVKKHAQQLARANEDLLHFAYGVSHDLQTPLRTVSNISELLLKKYGVQLDGQGTEFINWIRQASARMSAMLADLLQFARVAGSELKCINFPLDQALATALETLRREIEESGAEIIHGPFPNIDGEPGQIAQVFQNLIGNSLKYRKKDVPTRIQIVASQEGNELVVTVSDNGVGFDDAYAGRIFDVFQRLNKTESNGTGIGLTICKRIIERHGGRIWATAKPGEGASFSYSIPIG